MKSEQLIDVAKQLEWLACELEGPDSVSLWEVALTLHSCAKIIRLSCQIEVLDGQIKDAREALLK